MLLTVREEVEPELLIDRLLIIYDLGSKSPQIKNSMDKDESNVGNCPHCTKIIFRDAVFNSEAVFITRCPHCQKPVKVCIRKKVEIILLPIDDRKGGNNPGTKLTTIIFVLFLPTAIDLLSDSFDILGGLF